MASESAPGVVGNVQTVNGNHIVTVQVPNLQTPNFSGKLTYPSNNPCPFAIGDAVTVTIEKP